MQSVILYLQVRVDIVWISVRRRGVEFLFLRQNRLYRPVELVFVHHYASFQCLLFETHFQSIDGARRALGDCALFIWDCAVRL